MPKIASFADDIVQGMAELLWPTRCAGCDRPGAVLCDDCVSRIARIDQAHACPRCGSPFGSLVCTECTRSLIRNEDAELPEQQPWDLLEGVCCFGVLTWPLADAIRTYKDAGERRLAPIFAQMLAGAVNESPVFDVRDIDAVTFVPATPDAFARRGFDHMEDVSHLFAQTMQLPLIDVLARRSHADQRGLSRAKRLENATHGCVALSDLSGKRILLVDDVLTTGATLAGAARALQARGASGVYGACVARAW